LAANNKQIIIPVHITYQFIDNKIVTEYGYWNSSELQSELQKINTEKSATDSVQEPQAVEDIQEVIDIKDEDLE
jgi:hypothetical protein